VVSPAVRVAPLAALRPGRSLAVEVEGRRIALFNVAGTVYATDDLCTHMGGPLSKGMLAGATVICPWHGARFDLQSGRVIAPPAGRDVGWYPTRIEGGSIVVEIGP
jgi:3-phenylpropionate/trans-cinnamate dioxygenase ferredoxin component